MRDAPLDNSAPALRGGAPRRTPALRGGALRVMQWVLRLCLAGLFVYAGALKLLDPAGFAEDISHYRLLPEALVAPFALGLPVLEVVVGAGLLSRAYMKGAAALCALLLGVFAVAMAQSKLRGIDLECGCFGASTEARVSWGKVTLDAVLAMLAAWLARPASTAATPAKDPAPAPPASPRP